MSAAAAPINAIHVGTQRYYERNAASYVASTAQAYVKGHLVAMAAALPPGAEVLDAGSGSGRDSFWLAAHGFRVHAIDSCAYMVRATVAKAEVRGEIARVEELEAVERYDGVWACGVLPHVSGQRQRETWARMFRSIRPGGVLYASYKLGKGERIDADGRYFLDMDLQVLRCLAASAGFVELRADQTPCAVGRPTQWISVLVQKCGTGGLASSVRLAGASQ
jgi:SAM-dependent methyltransferase